MDDMLIVIPEEADRLEPFRELNKQDKKAPWDQRLELIKKQFPSVTRLDWKKVFGEDPTLWGRVVNDILKADAAEPGRPGKRPAIETHEAQERLRQFVGEDYTSLPFHEAFKILKAHRSIRQIAHKVDLDRNYVYKLLRDEAFPTAKEMEKIAASFGKKPSFFHEYRMAYVFGVLFYKLESMPDVSVSLYRKVRGER